MSHTVHFVGAGPGDPELITVKGKRLLLEADRIIYAGSLVPPSLIEERKTTASVFDSAPLSLEETHRLIVEGFRLDERVVRLHTGDPSLYGAIREQMELLDIEGIPYEVVPGVSAVFAAAASLKRELTVPGLSQTLILTRLGGRTPVPEKENLASLAAHEATLAIYLSVHQIVKVIEDLSTAYPPETPVTIAYRVGWPEETILRGTLADIAEKVAGAHIHRQALILVGKALGDAEETVSARSRLYDKAFDHGYRSARNPD